MHASSQEIPFTTAHPGALHTRYAFRFSIPASFLEAAPLFGPLKEKVWAGDAWKPVFLHPVPAEDIPGAVFQTEGDHGTATWINTAFDMQTGRVQYVYVIPDVMVTLLHVSLTTNADSRTDVEVVYERTALAVEMNAIVSAHHSLDPHMREHWETSINEYFAKQRK